MLLEGRIETRDWRLETFPVMRIRELENYPTIRLDDYLVNWTKGEVNKRLTRRGTSIVIHYSPVLVFLFQNFPQLQIGERNIQT